MCRCHIKTIMTTCKDKYNIISDSIRMNFKKGLRMKPVSSKYLNKRIIKLIKIYRYTIYEYYRKWTNEIYKYTIYNYMYIVLSRVVGYGMRDTEVIGDRWCESCLSSKQTGDLVYKAVWTSVFETSHIEDKNTVLPQF